MYRQAQIVEVSRERHRYKKWQRSSDYSIAATLPIVQVTGAELPLAVHAMPLALSKEADRFLLVALLGLTPGSNLFVGPNGQWLGTYVPAALRSYPFRMVQPQGSQDSVLVVDEGSGLVVEDSALGNPFFDADGSPSASIKTVLNFFTQIEWSGRMTERAVSALAEAGAIQPWSLRFHTGQSEQNVQGLYRVDEAALNALSGDDFGKLRSAGALPVAYAQLFSMSQINLFPQLARLQSRLAPKPTDVLERMESLDPLFGINLGSGDTIKFA